MLFSDHLVSQSQSERTLWLNLKPSNASWASIVHTTLQWMRQFLQINSRGFTQLLWCLRTSYECFDPIFRGQIVGIGLQKHCIFSQLHIDQRFANFISGHLLIQSVRQKRLPTCEGEAMMFFLQDSGGWIIAATSNESRIKNGEHWWNINWINQYNIALKCISKSLVYQSIWPELLIAKRFSSAAGKAKAFFFSSIKLPAAMRSMK